jgi:hypothetical protein
MRFLILACAMMVAAVGCGKDDKSQAERDAEVKKVLQQGAAGEQKMVEGMTKAVENLEKKTQENPAK